VSVIAFGDVPRFAGWCERLSSDLVSDGATSECVDD
jgi:hypothetical protein